MELGEKIKYFRKKKGLTIKELSELTNLSIGFISNLERNLNSPSVSNLQQICEVLGINLMEILQSTSEKDFIIRKNERKEIFTTEDNKIKFKMLTNGNKELNGISISIEGNSEYSDISWGHNYDELGVVVKGSLEIQIDNETYLLNEGDSVYVSKFTPHRYRNPSNETNITYWFSVKE
ncbi:helix-turn-helix domain-containing protein [Tepidibacter formicigenes]|jgi:transcriptional regulator with XRE-family HTH domain|uniref:Transcriptional regulator, XRE family with cupin sensor n=1 Tax=Tepidibacter formicigenes DSM 15518 TaxID=1123349 RepID=A0A1M6LCE2_9FIRM|nr:cupin domain-containing protein [Tepidibacter formicigenes]SHJ68828.1 transcriptional regulator, XRE family with cupin sensor [Tepidibacter formicigenes DSM 15518]